MNAYEIVVSKPEQKRPLERPGHRRELEGCGQDSSHWTQTRAGSCEHGNKLPSSIKGRELIN
jgi:hypothetical protein